MSKAESERLDILPRWKIPSTWEWVSISDVGKVITGNTPSTKVRSNYGQDIPFVKPPELNDKGVWSATEGLSKSGMQSARLLPAGAVLVSCIGGLGKTGLAKVPVAFNQQINGVVFDDRVLPEFGFYYSQTLKEWLYGVASATTLPIVNKGKFQRAPFPLAPISEQKSIVAEIEKQFSRLDEAVANLKRVKANLKRYKAAVLKVAVEGKLTEEWRKAHPDVEPASELLKRILAERRGQWDGRGTYKEPLAPDVVKLPLLPEGWTWCMSDSLFSFVTSGSRGWAKYYADSGAIFLRIGNLDHENIRLDLKEVQHVSPPMGAEGVRTIVQQNDILISITADVGMVALVPSGLGEAYINQHVALARLWPLVNFKYVAFYLCASEGGWGYFKKLQRGATKVGLGLDDIRAIPVSLPPLAEQERIVAEVERRLSVVEELERTVEAHLQRANRLSQSVLERAFSGNLIP
jgi:type I restriction enzyme S subunit